MERLDFCSFVVTLRRYIYADALGNQLDLLCLLFGSFLQSTDAEDFTFDNGQVCRWLNGTARVSPKITSFYLVGENQEKLTQDMETKILTIMSDPAMAAQRESLTQQLSATIKQYLEIENMIQPEDEDSVRQRRTALRPDVAFEREQQLSHNGYIDNISIQIAQQIVDVQIVGDKISEKVQTSMAQHKEVPDR